MNTEVSTATTSMVVETKPALAELRRVDLKRMFRLRLPAMLLVFLGVAGPGMFMVWRRIPREYTAMAEVRFLASTPRVMENANSTDFMVPYEKFLNTQVGLITGNTILSRILEDPEVHALKFIEHNDDPLSLLRVIIKATAEQESELVKLTCTLPDRDAAKLLVDKTLAAYMKYALAEEADTGGERLRVLQKERDARQAELDTQLKRLNELQQEVGMPLEAVKEMGTGEVTPYRQMLALAEEDLLKANSKVSLLNQNLERMSQLEEQLKSAPVKAIFDFGIEDSVTADPRVSAMRQDAAKAEVAYKIIADKYADNSPALTAEKDNFSAAKNRVAQIEREVRGEILASTRAKMEEELALAQKQQDDAQQRKEKFEGMISGVEQRALSASRTIAELDEVKFRAEATRNNLRALTDEITSIGMESKAPARVKLASPATVPTTPHAGRRFQLFLLVGLLAMSMSFGTGFVLELTDQQVRTPHDVVTVTTQPVLAAIPHAGAEKIPSLQPLTTIAAEMPDTAMANEFRKLVARLAFSDIELVEINSCLVTSPIIGDGKTTVACNLALALAEANRRVLLIDTVPGHNVERIFELENDRGLSEALFGGYELRDVVRATTFTGLFVLGPGIQPGNLSVKLASREMVELLEQCERHFDHVIIDSAPALLLSDAKCLAPIVDGVVIVVGAGKSRLGMIQRTVAELNLTGSTLLGIVVNGIRPSWGGYLRNNLKLFDRYFNGKNTDRGNVDLPEMEVVDVETVDAP